MDDPRRTTIRVLVLLGTIASVNLFAGTEHRADAATIVITENFLLTEDNLAYEDQDLVVDQTATLRVEGHHRFRSLQVVNGSWVSHTSNADSPTAHHKLDLAITGEMLVDASSGIYAAGRGYGAGRTLGNTDSACAPPGTSPGYGGSYGSYGEGSCNEVYGDYKNPNELGSGGGCVFSAGGGLVRVAAGSIVLDGVILAGGSNPCGMTGGGSGGGVLLEADSFSGTGSIDAAGAPGGGGGRVAIYAHDLSRFDARSISGGTVYLRDLDEPNGTLLFHGFRQRAALGLPGQTSLALSDALVVRGNSGHPMIVAPIDPALRLEFLAPVTVEDSGSLQLPEDVTFRSTLTARTQGEVLVNGTLLAEGDVAVTGGAKIEVPGRLVASRPISVGSEAEQGGILSGGRIEAPGLRVVNRALVWAPLATETKVHTLELVISGEVYVDATSSIYVGGRGYLPRHTVGNTTEGGADPGWGGSHGGTAEGYVNRTYGDPYDPEAPGAGGGESRGGGVLRLSASRLTLPGPTSYAGGGLHADGQEGQVANGGGGAGGSILVEVEVLDAPQGRMYARGAEHGGGGGRVAVYALDAGGFDESMINVTGGRHQGRPDGEAGSKHVFQFRRRTHARTHKPVGLNDGYLTTGFDYVTIDFNKALDLAKLGLRQFEIDGPRGAIFPTALTEVGDRTYRLDFPPQSRDGHYRFTALSSLLDVEGFPLDQDVDGQTGEPREDDYSFVLVVDTVGPRVTRQFPDRDITGTVDHIDVWFSEAIDTTTLTSADVTLIGPDGTPVTITRVRPSGLNRFAIEFLALSAVGRYELSLGPDVRDLAGNQLDMDDDGSFGEETDDVYTAEFQTVEVDFEFSDVVVQPLPVVAGEAITVSWTGRNASGARILGDWTDGIYLSTDARWDIRDAVVTRVKRTGGLEESQVYTPSVSSFVPGLLPGRYYVLVRADIFDDKREIEGEENNVVAVGPFGLDVRRIPADGTRVAGTTGPDNRARYFAVQVPPGSSMELALNGLLAGGNYEVYISFESIPTRLSYDLSSTVGGPNQKVTLTGTATGGTYYILVYEKTGVPTSFEIGASTGEIFLSAVSPRRQQNRGSATLTLTGAGFDASTTFALVLGGGQRLPISDLNRVSPETVIGYVNINGAPPGLYDVVATRGSSTKTLPGGFEIVQAPPPNPRHKPEDDFHVSLSPPRWLRNVGRETGWVEYANLGDVPMAAPLMVVEAPEAVLAATEEEALSLQHFVGDWPPAVGSSVQLIATGSGATPGILQPGDSGRVPFYYLGLRRPVGRLRLDYTLGVLTEFDDTHIVCPTGGHPAASASAGGAGGGSGASGAVFVQPCSEEPLAIDWNKFRDESRPDGLSSDAWDAVVGNLQLQLGGFRPIPETQDQGVLWVEYVRRLARTATYLGSIGLPANDVRSLFGHEVAKASASLTPVRDLASVVDASSPAPGFPLVFRRTFGTSIFSRHELGPFGRGWSHNWDVRIDTYDHGAVVRGPSNADQFFRREGDGTYRASPGDTATLVIAAGRFVLTEADRTIWRFGAANRLERVEDPNGNHVTLTYTEGSRLARIAHSNGDSIEIVHDSAGFIESILDVTGPGASDGLLTRYEYDGEHLARVIAPGDRTTAYGYFPSAAPSSRHALTSIIHPDSRRDEFEYDGRGRLTLLSRGDGTDTRSFLYGEDGQVTGCDCSGESMTFQFGPSGQLAQVRDGMGNVVRLRYDSSNLLTRLIGPGGEEYRYTYDERGNLVGVVDALRLRTTFAYDPVFQRLVSFADPRGHGIGYGYDSKGNLTSITYEGDSSETFTPDPTGAVSSWRNRRGQVINYGYNAAGQLTSKDDPTTPGIDYVYGYDALGNLTFASGPEGTIQMAYDPETGDLLRIDYPGSRFFVFAYDPAGRRIRREDQTEDVIRYDYDAVGRFDRMTDGAGAAIVDYDYDSRGRLIRKTLGNGVYTTYDHDPAGRLLHLVNRKPDGTILSRFDYEYNASGQRTSMGTLEGVHRYEYDALGQLVFVEYPDGRRTRYAYDGAGNRIEVLDSISGTTAYATNDLNQYTTVGDVEYRYDADGNMTRKIEPAGTTVYSYDIENRLVGLQTPTETWTYAYDALGQRVAVTHNGGTTRSVIDPIGLGNLAAEYDAAGNLLDRYDHGIGLFARRDAEGVEAYFTFDAVGNTQELTGVDGAILNSYGYEPFGASMGKTERVDNRLEFGGEFGGITDSGNLVFMRHRYYAEFTGKFLQADLMSIFGDSNLYRFAKNDPISFVDPMGLLGLPVGRWVDLGPGGGIGCGSADGTIDTSFVPDQLLGVDMRRACRNHDTNYELCRNKLGSDLQLFSDILADNLSLRGLGLGITYGLAVSFFAQEAYGKSCPKPAPARPPVPPVNPRGGGFSEGGVSRDPNDKLGPAGSGPDNLIRAGEILPYTIHFENTPDADAPAVIVTVTDRLDDDLDLSSFELREIAFAGKTIAVPPGLDHYEDWVQFEALDESHTPLLVEVTASVDFVDREFTLSLFAIDPLTGWIPGDAAVGFLYPNDDTGRGEGHVSYTIRHAAGLPSGTVIENTASIVFDFNEAIQTPTAWNTLDAAAPESRVLPLPARSESGEFRVDWVGADDPGGSGIASYDIFASLDGGPFVLLFGQTPYTFATVTSEPGHSFAFYSVARDVARHVEAPPTDYVPDAVIETARVFHRGDANADGLINITDGIFVLNYLFLGGAAPTCLEAANADDSRALDITDGIYILNWLFLGGPAPPSPGPAESPCGPDPAGSPTAMGCDEYLAC